MPLPAIMTTVKNQDDPTEPYVIVAHTGEANTVWAERIDKRKIVLEQFFVWGDAKYREKRSER